MKKVLVCALAALFLMATCLTAFAEVAYNTTTTYTTAGELEIKTTVTGTTSGDMYTYLAHTGDSAADDTIVYIDQQTSTGDDLVFSFSSDKVANINAVTGVKVKSGSSVEGVAANDQTDELAAAKREVKVNLISGAATLDSKMVTFPETYVAGAAISAVATGIVVPSGYKYDADAVAATNNTNVNVAADGKVMLTDYADLTNGAIIDVYVTEEYNFEATVDDSVTNAGRYVGYHGGEKSEKLTIFGKVDTDIDLASGDDWGGIILAKSVAELATSTRIYPAKFKGTDGTFAVQLVNILNADESNAELMEDWYACIYVKDKAGNTELGGVIEKFITPASTPDAE